MSVHSGLPAQRAAGVPGEHTRLLRYAAAAAAAVSALLYVLMATVASVAPDFSLPMGGVFAAVAVLLLLSGQRRVWITIALLDLVAIAGYFAVAGGRDPHFEIWGLAIKASQVVLLAALTWLIFRAPRAASRR